MHGIIAAALPPSPKRIPAGRSVSSPSKAAAMRANVEGENSQMQTADCSVVFARDLPRSVAPKKVQKGIWKQRGRD